MKKQFLTVFFVLSILSTSKSQNCDPSTPVFNVDLSAQPNGTWISPAVKRNGLCCGNSNPDKCIQFNLTLDSAATMINFNIYSGAMPGGSMYYQINCGPATAVGQPVCLSGAGPFIITFCKPGNNTNQYSITSISQPALNGIRYVSQACQGKLIATGLDENSIQWTTVPNNPIYNSYLNCSSGCDTVTISPPVNSLPAFIDYQVCGNVAGGCSSFPFCDTIRVHFVNDLAVTINPSNPTICFGGTNALFTANGSGGLGPYTYLWNTGETTATINKGPGTYSVQVFDQMNCSMAFDTVTVIALPSPISVNAGPDDLFCMSNGFYQLHGSVVVASGGIWSAGGSFFPNDTSLNAQYYPSSSEINNGYANIQLITTGNYNCPADTDIVHLDIAPTPDPVIVGSSQACVFSTVQYSTTLHAGNSYSWSVNNGTIINSNQNIVDVHWTATGASQLTVIETNSAGCDSIFIFSVNILPKPVPEITGSQLICRPEIEAYSVINYNPVNSYSWSALNGTIFSSTGNSINADWNFSGLGNITVTEISPSGCDSSVSFPVNIIDKPIPILNGAATVCENEIQTYTANADSMLQYQWSVSGGNIISQNANVIKVQWYTAGTGTITVQEINGGVCDSSIIMNVVILNKPDPVISGPNTMCSNKICSYYISGLLQNETILWTTTGGIILGNDNTNQVQILWQSTGTGEVEITVTNQNGCDSSLSYSVNVLDGPIPQINGMNKSCMNDTSVYSSFQVTYHSYNWQVNGGNIINGFGTNSITVLWWEEGIGSVTLTESTPAGCDSTISLMVTVNPKPIPVLNGIPQVCTNETAVFSTNVSNDLYNWMISGANILGNNLQQSVSVNFPSPGNFSLWLTETNTLGCSSLTSIPVTVNSLPDVNIAGNITGCTNTNSIYTLPQMPGITYQYSIVGGNILSNNNGNLNIDWTNTGNNSISVLATNNLSGCAAQNTFNVSVPVLPQPYINANSFFGCPPLNVTFYNNQPGSNCIYTWDFGDGGTSINVNPAHTFSLSGTFPVKVIVTNAVGCTDSARGAVTVFPSPFSNFDILNDGDKVYAEFQNVQLSNRSNGADVYSWNLGNGVTTDEFEPQFSYDKPGVYTISLDVENIYGCHNIISKTIEAIVPEDIFVPNTFTPNDDNTNDFFSVAFKNINSATIFIFDRWGEMIYKSEDMNFKWNGLYQGRKIEHDDYVYLIEATGYYGTKINRTGKLTVIY
jgi:gliding motility-associated-like protein